MIELKARIPLTTPKGKGWAYFIKDESMDHNLVWTVFLDETGECWMFDNKDIRIQPNFTYGINCKLSPREVYNNELNKKGLP